ncbi:MAG: hypothetical protein RRY69_02345 [Oscillospiraceae bacterium]
MFYSVDRIEGDTVILCGEDGICIEACVKSFARKPVEGIIVFDENGIYFADAKKTKKRRAEAAKLLAELTKDR